MWEGWSAGTGLHEYGDPPTDHHIVFSICEYKHQTKKDPSASAGLHGGAEEPTP